MNCKPGELVRYVGRNHYGRPNVFGWVGRTVRLISEYENTWEVSPALPGGIRRKDGKWTDGKWIADCSLRPIRDPGEDAVDEMVQKLGKPEEVTA